MSKVDELLLKNNPGHLNAEETEKLRQILRGLVNAPQGISRVKWDQVTDKPSWVVNPPKATTPGVSGSGTTGMIAEWYNGGLTNSTLKKTGAGLLTLHSTGNYTLTAANTGTLPTGTGTANRLAVWADENTLATSNALTTVGDLAYFASVGGSELSSTEINESALVTYFPADDNTVIETLTLSGVEVGDTVRFTADLWSSAKSGFQPVSPMAWSFEVRKENVSGATVFSSPIYDGSIPYTESSGGHNKEWTGSADDTSPPTSGVYVLVIRLSAGYFGAGRVYSDARYLKAARVISGAGPDRLPIGNSGDILKVSSGIPAWSSLAAAGIVPTSRTITEGAGLAGNTYNLSSDRTLAMGTPSTLTYSTTNDASGTTHTHAITSSSNPGTNASLLASAVGGYLTLERIYLGTVRTQDNIVLTGGMIVDADVAASSGVDSILTYDGYAYNGSGGGTQWMGQFVRMHTVAGQTAPLQMGSLFTVLYHSAGHTLPDWRGLETGAAYVDGAGSSITESYGIVSTFPTCTNGGTVGLAAQYLVSSHAVTGITNYYGVYSPSASIPSYWKGQLQLEDNSVPIEAWRSGGTSTMRFSVYADSTTNGGRYAFRAAGGTKSSPTDVLNNYVLGEVQFWGYINGAHRQQATIRTSAIDTISASSYPANMYFLLNKQGATTQSTIMTLHNSGAVGINTGTGAPRGVLGVVATGASDVVSSFKGASSQTGNLTNWENASNALLSYVDATGGLVINETGGTTADVRVETDTEANMLFIDASADNMLLGGTTNGIQIDKGGILSFIGTSKIKDGTNIPFDTTTGTKIGTGATQKIGFWNAAPVVQSTGWSAINGSGDKSFDVSATTLGEVADVLATLVNQLKTYGILGA